MRSREVIGEMSWRCCESPWKVEKGNVCEGNRPFFKGAFLTLRFLRGVASSFYVVDLFLFFTNISRAILILKINSWALPAGAGYKTESGQ